MAGKKSKQKQKDWKDEIGLDYAIYPNEKNYVSPEGIAAEKAEQLVALRQKFEGIAETRRSLLKLQ